jgi:ketosteroid isomerase-like protein
MGGPRRVLQEFYDRFGEGDLDAAVSMFAVGVRITDPGLGRVEGLGAVRSYLAGLKEAVPDARAIVERGFEIGNTAIVEGRFTGTGAAPSGDLPLPGAQIDLAFADFAVIRDGRIIEYRTYYDQVTLLTQLGQFS